MEIKAQVLEAIESIKGINEKKDEILVFNAINDFNYIFKNKSIADCLWFFFFTYEVDSETAELEDMISDIENDLKNNKIKTVKDVIELMSSADFYVEIDHFPAQESEFNKFIKNVKVIRPTKEDLELVKDNMKTLEGNRNKINKELADYREELKRINKYIK